ncbi:hypothetical protein [Mangrovibacterium diazotrophicum]|uniref:Uncharacterized protein n=1 Tax=Mangrovibacterium diazotrophicum TaxID=1261403 RepID=A0A419W4T8_9BACT|nr:hypothetical protein [Mangrovibacterium diazotrophicum]RKD90478.1 hypothetical protein BC643_0818 [Mangrovibacterium diazotrophicum]
MKTLFKTCLLLCLFFVASCSKDTDDDEPEVHNYFMVGDTEYNLQAAVLEYGGSANGSILFDGYLYSLVMYSGGLVYKDLGSEGWTLSGEGNILQFFMFSDTGLSLEAGRYDFYPDEPYPTGTFAFGLYVINWDSAEDDSEAGDLIVSGRVTVAISDDIYEFTIECTGDSGIDVCGYYKGAVRYLNTYNTNAFVSKILKEPELWHFNP